VARHVNRPYPRPDLIRASSGEIWPSRVKDRVTTLCQFKVWKPRSRSMSCTTMNSVNLDRLTLTEQSKEASLRSSDGPKQSRAPRQLKRTTSLLAAETVITVHQQYVCTWYQLCDRLNFGSVAHVRHTILQDKPCSRCSSLLPRTGVKIWPIRNQLNHSKWLLTIHANISTCMLS
jgi:hypothetical protein